MVGISSSMENPKLIMYPSISICAHRDSASKYFTNVASPWSHHAGSTGPISDPNEILDSLSYHAEINKSRFASGMLHDDINQGCITSQGLHEPAFINLKVQAEMGNRYWAHSGRQAILFCHLFLQYYYIKHSHKLDIRWKSDFRASH